jgi:hypothetical protein
MVFLRKEHWTEQWVAIFQQQILTGATERGTALFWSVASSAYD